MVQEMGLDADGVIVYAGYTGRVAAGLRADEPTSHPELRAPSSSSSSELEQARRLVCSQIDHAAALISVSPAVPAPTVAMKPSKTSARHQCSHFRISATATSCGIAPR